MTIDDMLKELGDMYRRMSPDIEDPAEENSWNVCVLMSDGEVRRHKTSSLYLASTTARDYLAMGAGAWIEDADGRPAYVTVTKSPEKN